MPVSGATIRDALAAVGAVGKQIRPLDELAAGADGALRTAPGLTAAGAAGFLATCMVESAWWRTTQEYGTGQRYAPYIGRTFIQITHPGNYRAFGQWCKARGLVADAETFVNNPKSLADIRWAWLGPVQYMDAHGLWPIANRGDFRGLSQGVNGGNGRIGTAFTPNGWKERQAAYAVLLRAGNTLLPTRTPTASPLEDEMPSVDDVWRKPIPDQYTPNPTDAMPADIALSWAVTHAARALDASLRCEKKLDAILAKLG